MIGIVATHFSFAVGFAAAIVSLAAIPATLPFLKNGQHAAISEHPTTAARQPSFRECSRCANTAAPLNVLAQRGVSLNLGSQAQKGGNHSHEWATHR